jgi:hypothetical protein
MRKFSVLIIAVFGCGGDSQKAPMNSSKPGQAASASRPAPPPEKASDEWTAVEMKPGWGKSVDPDGDCKQTWNGGTLTIAVPGKVHELQGKAVGKQNAPRTVVERTGDFAMNVKASGKLAPKPVAAGSKFAPYQGGGILAWQGNDYFIRMERAKLLGPNGQQLTYINFEYHGQYGAMPIQQKQLRPDETVHLRMERRGNKVVGLMSGDGTSWTTMGETFLPTDKPLQVGVAAVNSSEAPLTAEFSDFKFFEKKK